MGDEEGLHFMRISEIQFIGMDGSKGLWRKFFIMIT